MWAMDNREEMRREIGERLVGVLSMETRQQIQGMPGPKSQAEQLRRWVGQALKNQVVQKTRGNIAADDLEEFFLHELDNDQRAALLALPRDEMNEELERRYVDSQLGLPGMPFGAPPGDRSFFGNRRGRPEDGRRDGRPRRKGDGIHGPPPRPEDGDRPSRGRRPT